jgi:hypothetical protein
MRMGGRALFIFPSLRDHHFGIRNHRVANFGHLKVNYAENHMKFFCVCWEQNFIPQKSGSFAQESQQGCLGNA